LRFAISNDENAGPDNEKRGVTMYGASQADASGDYQGSSVEAIAEVMNDGHIDLRKLKQRLLKREKRLHFELLV
jgi:hypothetical protein